jgi:hypothetical protein
LDARRSYLLWILAAGGIGWAASFSFGNVLHLSRYTFISVYSAMAISFLVAYFRWSQSNIAAHFKRHLWLGLIGAGVFSLVMVMGVVRQGRSAPPGGSELAFALLWLGIVYGVVDAFLLTVMPVLATFQFFERAHSVTGAAGRIFRAAAAMAASLFVTGAYHLGYAEFQGEVVMLPLIGNAIITFGYLLTANPITPIVAHVAMHVAAVLWGIETTVQLPPHY